MAPPVREGEMTAAAQESDAQTRDVSAKETGETGQRLEMLVELAERLGWRWALQAVYHDDPDLVRYATDRSRSLCVDLLGLDGTQDVLEVGTGLGQMTVELGRRSASVESLEVVEAQARFAAVRCRQEGVSNARISPGGASGRLPFPDASFDRVVFNLVLEWCASRSGRDPEEFQKGMLAELRRVLRPGGILYVATKNRFGAPYVLGGPDEHWGGLRWGSLMPRRLAAFLSGGDGGARLPSRRWLERALAGAGFKGVEGLWAMPDARWPKGFVRFSDLEAVRAGQAAPAHRRAPSRRSAAFLRLLPAFLVREFSPSLAYLAQA